MLDHHLRLFDLLLFRLRRALHSCRLSPDPIQRWTIPSLEVVGVPSEYVVEGFCHCASPGWWAKCMVRDKTAQRTEKYQRKFWLASMYSNNEPCKKVISEPLRQWLTSLPEIRAALLRLRRCLFSPHSQEAVSGTPSFSRVFSVHVFSV